MQIINLELNQNHANWIPNRVWLYIEKKSYWLKKMWVYSIKCNGHGLSSKYLLILNKYLLIQTINIVLYN